MKARPLNLRKTFFSHLSSLKPSIGTFSIHTNISTLNIIMDAESHSSLLEKTSGSAVCHDCAKRLHEPNRTRGCVSWLSTLLLHAIISCSAVAVLLQIPSLAEKLSSSSLPFLKAASAMQYCGQLHGRRIVQSTDKVQHQQTALSATKLRILVAMLGNIACIPVDLLTRRTQLGKNCKLCAAYGCLVTKPRDSTFLAYSRGTAPQRRFLVCNIICIVS